MMREVPREIVTHALFGLFIQQVNLYIQIIDLYRKGGTMDIGQV